MNVPAKVRRKPPFLGLALLALCVGVAVTWLARSPDEATLIARAAAHYEARTGNSATDCYGRPGEVEGVRLYVICRPEDGEAQVFLLNNRGRQVDLPSLAALLKDDG